MVLGVMKTPDVKACETPGRASFRFFVAFRNHILQDAHVSRLQLTVLTSGIACTGRWSACRRRVGSAYGCKRPRRPFLAFLKGSGQREDRHLGGLGSGGLTPVQRVLHFVGLGRDIA